MANKKYARTLTKHEIEEQKWEVKTREQTDLGGGQIPRTMYSWTIKPTHTKKFNSIDSA